MKKNKFYRFAVVALVFSFLFVFSSSALDIGGDEYWLCGRADQSNSSDYSLIDFVVYQNYSSSLRDSSAYASSTDLHFIESVINTLGFVKIGTWDLSSGILRNSVESFNEGTYYIADEVYISPNIQKFISCYNGIYNFLGYQGASNDSIMNSIRNGSINFVFTYNSQLCLLLENQIVSFFTWLSKNGYLNTNGQDIARTFETSYLYNMDISSVYLSEDPSVLYYQVIVSSSPFINFGVTVNFNIEKTVRMLSKSETWAFLPTPISNLLISFFSALFGVCLIVGFRRFF